MRTQLLAALEESLAATPDPEDVLSAVHRGIERRRRHHRHYRVGLAIGTVALTLVASVLAISAIRDGQRDTATSAVDWRTTIQLVPVPDDTTLKGYQASAVGEDLWFTSSSNIIVLHVFVDNVDRTRRIDQPGWDPIEINGRAARQISRQSETRIVLPLPSGRWASIRAWADPPLAVPPSDKLREIAGQAANALRETGDTSVTVGFAPTYLPAGQRVIGINSGPAHAGFGIIESAAGSLRPGEVRQYPGPDGIVDERRPADLGQGVSISMQKLDLPLSQLERIADIQGRPAFRTTNDSAVLVPDFHGGTLEVSATLNGEYRATGQPPVPELLPLAELIKVAEGVRWVG